jgi:myo-inositol-1(or 4)-monophosphatase
MRIDTLREIGSELLRAFLHRDKKQDMREVIGIGAAGDKTYQIDKTAEDIILSGLAESGEGLTVFSEEAGVKDMHGGGITVVVDPVDGSRNAVSGIPFFCASIAFASGNIIGDIDTAYILNLINGDEFWAEKGEGAFLNGERIHTRKDESFSLVACEAQFPRDDIPYLMPLLKESGKVRCLGATALDLAYLASGAISVFATPSPSRSFDFAGGFLLVREAGGVVTDIKGNPIDNLEISLKRSSPLLASANKTLHKKALDVLNRQ